MLKQSEVLHYAFSEFEKRLDKLKMPIRTRAAILKAMNIAIDKAICKYYAISPDCKPGYPCRKRQVSQVAKVQDSPEQVDKRPASE